MTRQDPLGLNNRYAQLQRLLVFDARACDDAVGGIRPAGSGSGSCADEVGGINLNLVAPLCTHLAERDLRVFEQDLVFYRSETDGDAGGVSHCVRADVKEIGGVYACRCAQDKLEGVLGVQLQA